VRPVKFYLYLMYLTRCFSEGRKLFSTIHVVSRNLAGLSESRSTSLFKAHTDEIISYTVWIHVSYYHQRLPS